MRLDIEGTCGALQRLQEELGSREPLRTAAIALHFIWGSGHLYDFEDYLACFNQDVSADSSPSFDTHEQAEAWLRQPLEPRHAHRLTVAGSQYSVGYSLDQGIRFLIRLPERAELAVPRRTSSPLMEEAITALQRARARGGSPAEMESIDSSLLALHFIQESGQLAGFESFFQAFDSSGSFPPLCSFGTRKEAELWLNAHPRPPHGAQVEIAGQRFSVGYSRDSGLRALVRTPALEEPGLTD